MDKVQIYRYPNNPLHSGMTFPLQQHWMAKHAAKFAVKQQIYFWASYNTKMPYGAYSGEWIKEPMEECSLQAHNYNDRFYSTQFKV